MRISLDVSLTAQHSRSGSSAPPLWTPANLGAGVVWWDATDASSVSLSGVNVLAVDAQNSVNCTIRPSGTERATRNATTGLVQMPTSITSGAAALEGTLPSAVAGPNPVTVVIIGNPTSYSGAFPNVRIGSGTTGAFQNEFCSTRYNDTNWNTTTADRLRTGAKPQITTFRTDGYAARTVSARVDGEDFQQGMVWGASSGSSASQKVFFGARSNGSQANNFAWFIVLIANRRLTDAEVQKLEGWAVHTWAGRINAIPAITLPSGHPYRNGPPYA